MACVILAGQVIAGACVSFTVTVNEQVDVLPTPSVAIQTLVVVPIGNVPPLGIPDTSAVGTGEEYVTEP